MTSADWMKFYPRDFWGDPDVEDLLDAAGFDVVASYMVLLTRAWHRRGFLSEPVRELVRLGLDHEVARARWDAMRHLWSERPEGWTQGRVERDWQLAVEQVARAQANGRKGGRPRAAETHSETQKETPGLSRGLATAQTQKETHEPSRAQTQTESSRARAYARPAPAPAPAPAPEPVPAPAAEPERETRASARRPSAAKEAPPAPARKRKAPPGVSPEDAVKQAELEFPALARDASFLPALREYAQARIDDHRDPLTARGLRAALGKLALVPTFATAALLRCLEGNGGKCWRGVHHGIAAVREERGDRSRRSPSAGTKTARDRLREMGIPLSDDDPEPAPQPREVRPE